MSPVLVLLSPEHRAMAAQAMREALERLRERLRPAWTVEKPTRR